MKRVISNDNIINNINHCDFNKLLDVCSDALLESYNYSDKVALLCGNNIKGLIALALAFKLKDICECDIYLGEEFNHIIIDNCERKGISIRKLNEYFPIEEYRSIVDGLFDSYSTYNDYRFEKVIKIINNSNIDVISVDINSGFNPNNGLGKNIIKSSLTVSLGCFRYGHFLNMSKDYINKIVNYRLFDVETDTFLLEIDDCKSIFNNRVNYSNKYSYGLVSIIGGSNNYTGSVKLCNMATASMRSGSGLTRLCVPNTIGNAILPNILEATMCVMPSRDGKMIFSKEDIDKALDKSTSLVIGMGWGKSEEYIKILEYIFNNYTRPIIVDADGINMLSEMDLNLIKNYKDKVVLTPHLREFSRISKIDGHIIINNPVKYVKEFAREYNCIVLLKGSTSVISDGEKVYLVNRGCSGMATAGSGDVLSGILGGLLAYNEVNLLTVSAAAYINGLAGEEAEKEVGNVSLMASDTVRHIPDVIKKMSIDN